MARRRPPTYPRSDDAYHYVGCYDIASGLGGYDATQVGVAERVGVISTQGQLSQSPAGLS